MLAQQLCATEEQLPTYLETQYEERDDKTTGRFPSNAEKSEELCIDQKTEAKGLKADQQTKPTEPKHKVEFENHRMLSDDDRRLLTQIEMETNESLEKNKKSDLVDLLDIAREEALTPPKLNLAERFARARGESSTMQFIEVQNMPVEKLSKLGLVELLRVARVTPYYRFPKSEFMRVSNSDLVDLLREAQKEYRKRYKVSNYRDMISRHDQKEESYREHEATTQEDTRVSKPKDISPSLPSATELELKGLKEMIDKIKLESNNRFDKVEGHLKTLETDLVEGRGEGCRSATTESDIATGSSTGSCSESTNAADTSSQVEQEVDPVNQAREQTVQEMCAVVVKSFGIYSMLSQLKQYTAQDKTFGAQDFDDLTTQVIRVGQDLDNSTSRVREALVKVVRHYK